MGLPIVLARRDCFVASLLAMTNMRTQPSIEKPRNDRAADCLVAPKREILSPGENF